MCDVNTIAFHFIYYRHLYVYDQSTVDQKYYLPLQTSRRGGRPRRAAAPAPSTVKKKHLTFMCSFFIYYIYNHVFNYKKSENTTEFCSNHGRLYIQEIDVDPTVGLPARYMRQ